MVYSYMLEPTDEVLDFLSGIRDYTPEEINEICIKFQEASNIITEDVLFEAADPSRSFTKLLPKAGSKLASQVKSTSSQIATVIRSNGINKESRKQIHNIIQDFYQKVADSMNEVFIPIDVNGYDANKISKGLALTFMDIVINSIICEILKLLIGEVVGTKIFAVVVAPIVEEASKQIAVKGKFDVEYTVVFNACELGLYVSQGVPVKVRLICVGMHLTTTFIHKILMNEKIQKFLGINKEDKDSKDKCGFIANIIGLLIHGTWNYLGVFSERFVRGIAKLAGIDV